MSDLPVRVAANPFVHWPTPANSGSIAPGDSEAAGAVISLTNPGGAARQAVGAILTHLCGHIRIVMPALSPTFHDYVKLECLIGESGLEVPIGATWEGGFLLSGASDNVSAVPVLMGHCQALPRPIYVPAGSRLAARGRKRGTAIITAGLYVQGIDASMWAECSRKFRYEQYLKGLAAQTGAQALYPIGVGTNVISGTPIWTFGSPVEIIASAANEMWVEGFCINEASLSVAQLSCIVEVLVNGVPQMSGAAAGRSSSFAMGYGPHYLAMPVYVAQGDRVSARIKSGGATTTYALNLRVREMN